MWHSLPAARVRRNYLRVALIRHANHLLTQHGKTKTETRPEAWQPKDSGVWKEGRKRRETIIYNNPKTHMG